MNLLAAGIVLVGMGVGTPSPKPIPNPAPVRCKECDEAVAAYKRQNRDPLVRFIHRVCRGVDLHQPLAVLLNQCADDIEARSGVPLPKTPGPKAALVRCKECDEAVAAYKRQNRDPLVRFIHRVCRGVDLQQTQADLLYQCADDIEAWETAHFDSAREAWEIPDHVERGQ